jgi:hypothetical protein
MVNRSNPHTWFRSALKVAEDPASSDWLKEALLSAINRDPGDAANDVDTLRTILRQRAKTTQALARKTSKRDPSRPSTG